MSDLQADAPPPTAEHYAATCPFCDEVVDLVFEANRRLLVAYHLDIYPTRVCEGSGRIAQIISGRVFINKDRRDG